MWLNVKQCIGHSSCAFQEKQYKAYLIIPSSIVVQRSDADGSVCGNELLQTSGTSLFN